MPDLPGRRAPPVPCLDLSGLGLGLLAALCVVLSIHTWDSPDEWMHLVRGRLIAQTGDATAVPLLVEKHPAATFYWLYQLAFYRLFEAGGYPAVAAVVASLWLTTGTLLIRATRATAAPVFAAAVFTLALLACEPRITPRPESVSYVLMAAFIAFVVSERRRTTRRFWTWSVGLVGLEVLWANMHGYFVLGPAILGTALVGALYQATFSSDAALRPQARTAVSRLALLIILLVVAAMVSPFGYKTWLGAYQHFRLLEPLRELITELRSPFQPALIRHLPSFQAFLALWVLVAAATVYQIWNDRRPTAAILLAMAGLWLSAGSVRSIPFVVVFGFPVVFAARQALEKRGISVNHARWLATLGIGVNLTIVALIGLVASDVYYEKTINRKRFGFGDSPITYAPSVSEYLQQSAFKGLIFNSPEIGGYLLFLTPALRLYGDSQYTDAAATRRYLEGQGPDGFERLDAVHKFDAVLVHIRTSYLLVRALLRSGRWTLSFGDAHHALLKRKGSPFSDQLAVSTPKYHAGEDLRLVQHALPIIDWSRLYLELDDPAAMRLLLGELVAAANVPAPVLRNALLLAINHRDDASVRLIVELRKSMRSLDADDELAVDRLLLHTPWKVLVPSPK